MEAMMALDERIVQEILELREHGGTIKGIARYLGISKNTVKKYIRQREDHLILKNDSKLAGQLVETFKKSPKGNMSRHLHSYRKAGNKAKTGNEMAGKRAEFTLKRYRELYKQSTKLEKGNILDEFCRITNYNRKYAIRILSKNDVEIKTKRQRPKKYSKEALYVIERIWNAADNPWSERLVALLPAWLPWAKNHMKWITPELENEILSISARQIDRRLKNQKTKLSRKMYGRTKPGKLLKQHIPIKTDNWNISEPGFTEIDLVSHSGPSSAGEFIYSLNITDILTGWVETIPIMGKTEIATLNGIKEIRKGLPFELKGIDSDNGSEFINNLLLTYCTKNNIQFTRSRPYKKDDNAHIEQKNWTHVRRIMGYNRYDSEFEFGVMINLYRKKLRIMMNLFQPCVKLINKERIGSKIKRKYDDPKTPLDRLVFFYNERNLAIPLGVQKMIAIQKSTDPFKLSTKIEKEVHLLKTCKKDNKAKVI